MSDRIHELLLRNLPEVFGEGDPARRRRAIAEFYTEDCEVYVGPGKFVGREALDKFAGELRATHPHFVYTPHGEPQVLDNAGRLARGLRPARRAIRVHRLGYNHRSRWQNRGPLRIPRLNAPEVTCQHPSGSNAQAVTLCADGSATTARSVRPRSLGGFYKGIRLCGSGWLVAISPPGNQWRSYQPRHLRRLLVAW